MLNKPILCIWAVFLKKNVSTYFCSMFVKYKLISVKVGRRVLEETRNRTEQKVPTLHKICASIRKFKVTDWTITQYWHVHFTKSLMNQTQLAVIVSNIVKRVVSYIIFTLHARNVRFQRVPRIKISDVFPNWDNASITIELFESRCSLNVRMASTRLRSYWRQTFRVYGVKMTRLTTRLAIF